MEWKVPGVNVWIRYAWEDLPLEVRTDSEIGSDDEIYFAVASIAHKAFARVVVRMSKIPIFFVQRCKDDTPLENFPNARNNKRHWKFHKHGFDGISIECNGVVVARLKFAEARSECLLSSWTTNKVNFIKFVRGRWTVGIRGMLYKYIVSSIVLTMLKV